MDNNYSPYFSSGPCKKYNSFNFSKLNSALINRSHRCQDSKKKIKKALEITKTALNIPQDYLIGITPGGATCAMEMAIWNILGQRVVDIFCWEEFSYAWGKDVQKLNIPNRYFSAKYGECPYLGEYNKENDVIFPLNGTTSGVWTEDLSWIPNNREGISLCDATSGAFCMDIDWRKLDVTVFSPQKGLGAEAGIGFMVLSPKAVHRINNYVPDRVIPRLFELRVDNHLNYQLFIDGTINTFSLITLEDYLLALRWYINMGGLSFFLKIIELNYQIIKQFVDNNKWIEFLVTDENIRSHVSVTLSLPLSDSNQIDRFLQILEERKLAYDIGSFTHAPKGLRIWCGPTINPIDLKKLLFLLKKVYYKLLD